MDAGIRRAGAEGFRWDGVEVTAYKAEDAAPFRDVTRQVLFDDAELDCQWRYFEVAPGGWSTLERHRHVLAVLVLRGRGRALVGDQVVQLGPHDLVSVPALTWHQFRAADDEHLGFLCLVNTTRDRPQLPGEAERSELAARSPEVAAFLASTT
jgi:quercetin dioxygenase-like cupin family protein